MYSKDAGRAEKGPAKGQDPTDCSREDRRWRSLRCYSAKLYTWVCAALSGEEFHRALFYAGSFDAESGGPESGGHECGGRRMRARGRLDDRIEKDRRVAREATVCMLHYLGLEEAEGVGRSALGSRLSVEALREVGFSDEAFSPSRPPTAARGGGARRNASAGVSGDSRDGDASAGGAIARHLKAFRFQRALDDSAFGRTLDEGDFCRGLEGACEPGVAAAQKRFDAALCKGDGLDCQPGLLSAASERLAATYASYPIDRAKMDRAKMRAPARDDALKQRAIQETGRGTSALGGGRPSHRPEYPRLELYPRTAAVEALHDVFSQSLLPQNLCSVASALAPHSPRRRR